MNLFCAVRRFETPPGRISQFEAEYDSPEELWTKILRGLPGHIATRLIQNDENPTKFLALSFWDSRQACLKAYATPVVRKFDRWFSCQAVAWEDIAFLEISPDEQATVAA